MLEQEISEILQTLIARSIGSREAISLGEILSAGLPRGVKSYLRAEVHQWLSDDLARAPRFSRIQASDPAGIRHLDVFVHSMAEHYIFMRREFLTTLEHAVLFTLNYLCHPHRTFCSFLFSNTSTITIDTLRAKARFVVNYQYLFSILDRIVVHRGVKEIDEATLRGLLLDIDRRVIEEHTPRQLASLAKPIFDFLLLRNATHDTSIPLRPVLTFFEDKGMDEVADYIEKVSHIRSRTDISLKELGDLLDDLLGPIPGKGSPLPSPQQSAESAGRSTPEEQPAAIADIVQQNPEVTNPTEPAPPQPLHEEQPVLDPVPLSPSVEEPFGDIRNTITAEQRQRFIRTICGKDEAFYEALLLKFNGMRQWSEASEYLRDIFAIHGIDPFSPVAVELTDVIQQRFGDIGRGDQ
jgi:hypothetical protein